MTTGSYSAEENVLLSFGSDQSEAFKGCQCHVGGLHTVKINQRQSPSSCQWQVGQSVISATSTSIITVATFRSKIMAETRQGFNTEQQCFSQVLLVNKATDTCCPSNEPALEP